MPHIHLQTVLLLLTFSVIVITFLRRFNFSPIIGLLVVGIIVGPHALAWLPDSESIMALAEIGVVFLLFTIGLEFSIPRLLAMREIVLKLGSSQVLITTFLVAGVAWLIGLSWQAAVVIGGALALSSTALVIKQLAEQEESRARHTQIAIGILLFQDAAVAPFLVVIPFLAASASDSLAFSLLFALSKGIFAFALMYSVGHWGLRPILRFIASMHSSELFTLTVLLVALTAAWLTHALGLSLTLGAFLAGMMLGETEFRHQIEAEIRPFRDILMSLFFIAIGTQLNVGLLPDIWLWVLMLTFLFVVFKGAIVSLLVKMSGYDKAVALRSGMVLAQGGEFSLVLIAIALEFQILQIVHSQVILATIIFSIILAPILLKYNQSFARFVFPSMFRRRRADNFDDVRKVGYEMKGHVILCGYGRAGQNIAHFLRHFQIDYLAFDLDPHVVKSAWEGGEHAFYVDSTHADALRAACIEKARAIVITFDHLEAARCISALSKHFNPDIKVIVRVPHDYHMEELKSVGATVVVPDDLESSLMLSINLLRNLGVPRHEITHMVDEIRDENYASLRGFFHDREDGESEALPHNLHTVLLNAKSFAVRKALSTLGLDSRDVTIKALFRKGRRLEHVKANMVLESGDALILEGCSDNLLNAEKLLLRGPQKGFHLL